MNGFPNSVHLDGSAAVARCPEYLTSFIPEVHLMFLPVLCVCVDNAFSTKVKRVQELE
jgi:hypothetical protein